MFKAFNLQYGMGTDQAAVGLEQDPEGPLLW